MNKRHKEMNILKFIPKLRRKSLGIMFISEGFEPPIQLQTTLQEYNANLRSS